MDENLKELDKIFKDLGGNAGAQTSSGFNNQKPDDGTYEAEIIDAEYKTNQAGDPYVLIHYGLENGVRYSRFLNLVAKNRDINKTNTLVSMFVNYMQSLGLDGESITDYVKSLPNLTGKKVTLNIKTNQNGYQSDRIVG